MQEKTQSLQLSVMICIATVLIFGCDEIDTPRPDAESRRQVEAALEGETKELYFYETKGIDGLLKELELAESPVKFVYLNNTDISSTGFRSLAALRELELIAMEMQNSVSTDDIMILQQSPSLLEIKIVSCALDSGTLAEIDELNHTKGGKNN